MPASRRRNIVATVLNLAGLPPPVVAAGNGPGCICQSCVQAWDRRAMAGTPAPQKRRRFLRPGLY
jgi:hypothetical protein